MDENTLNDLVRVLQVGFAGYVAIYMMNIVKTNLQDIVKQNALQLEILSEIREELRWQRQMMIGSTPGGAEGAPSGGDESTGHFTPANA